MRGDEFRAFAAGRWADLVATAYLIAPERRAAGLCVVAALADMRKPWRRFAPAEPAGTEALRRTVREAMRRLPVPEEPAASDLDAGLLAALRSLTSLARAAVALHVVRGMPADAAGIAIRCPADLVVREAQRALAYLCHATGDDPESLRRRLSRFGATAASSPLPLDLVTRAVRRSTGRIAVAAGVVVAIAAGLGWLQFVPYRAAYAVPPGDGGPDGTMSREVTGPPYPVPSAPYRLVYRDVHIRLPDPGLLCGAPLDFDLGIEFGEEFGVDLHDPQRVGSYPFVSGRNRGDISRGAECRNGDVVTRQRQFGAAGDLVDDAGIGPEGCAAAILDDRFGGYDDGKGTTMCLVSAADPDRGRPLLLVRLVTVADDLEGTIEYVATAWTGGPPAAPAAGYAPGST
jgi:hypothetical protein